MHKQLSQSSRYISRSCIDKSALSSPVMDFRTWLAWSKVGMPQLHPAPVGFLWMYWVEGADRCHICWWIWWVLWKRWLQWLPHPVLCKILLLLGDVPRSDISWCLQNPRAAKMMCPGAQTRVQAMEYDEMKVSYHIGVSQNYGFRY